MIATPSGWPAPFQDDDTIVGGPGDDYIDGGVGTDTAVYSGNRVDYLIQKTSIGYLVTDMKGNDGVDTLVDVEVIRFADTVVDLRALSLAPGATIDGPRSDSMKLAGTCR